MRNLFWFMSSIFLQPCFTAYRNTLSWLSPAYKQRFAPLSNVLFCHCISSFYPSSRKRRRLRKTCLFFSGDFFTHVPVTDLNVKKISSTVNAVHQGRTLTWLWAVDFCNWYHFSISLSSASVRRQIGCMKLR